jgi:hypothetical protein
MVQGNISTQTLRILRGVLPTSTVWTALKPDTEFLSSEATLDLLREFFPPPEEGGEDETDSIPDVIRKESEKPLVMSALGGLISCAFFVSYRYHFEAYRSCLLLFRYLKQLNLDKDLLSQRNFDIYDPVRPGQTLYLDGQTLAHIEVRDPILRPWQTTRANSSQPYSFQSIFSGPRQQRRQRWRHPPQTPPAMRHADGQAALPPMGLSSASPARCDQPTVRFILTWRFGGKETLTKVLLAFLMYRLDAVEELMNHSSFQTDFKKLAKGEFVLSSLSSIVAFLDTDCDQVLYLPGLPDLERLVSRIHAGRCKLSEFIKVLDVRLDYPDLYLIVIWLWA